jgi:class 3 adenylate cyclase/CheY-like chemotaxis protein
MKSTARHQLRTPLNHIIGYCELLLEEAAGLGDERFLRDLHRIHAAGKRLLGVVEDLFDPAKGPAIGSTQDLTQYEVRTPLSEILGSVEMLQEDATYLSADVLADLGKIAAAARQLLPLLAEYLMQEWEAFESGQPASRRVTTFLAREVPAQIASYALTGAILVVDDDPSNRDILSRRLIRLGHEVTTAADGREAIDTLRRSAYDLLLLDIQMPEMDGYQVLELLKRDTALRAVPVIVLSASNDSDGVAHCIAMGAEDYLPKPFDPVLLQARIGACLEKKQLRDREQLHLRQIQAEQENAERLLLNILPPAIAARLKKGEQPIADSFSDATVLFGDLVGFTSVAAAILPAQVVETLNGIFSAFDRAVADLGLEKIKTIGDAYMAVGGLPVPRLDHAQAVADLALRMLDELARFNERSGANVEVRIGIHSGPVVAGIIGRHKFAYDVWGDAVNVASRMESQSLPGRIHVTAVVEERLRASHRFEPRGPIEVKGVGTMPTFFLIGRGD